MKGVKMSEEQEKMSREELRLLCQRVKLIDAHLDALCSSSSVNNKKRPPALTNGTSEPTNAALPPVNTTILPSLCEALALDIPFDLKQRIANSTKSNALLPSRSPNTQHYQFAFALNAVQTPPPPHLSQLMNSTKFSNVKSTNNNPSVVLPPSKK